VQLCLLATVWELNFTVYPLLKCKTTAGSAVAAAQGEQSVSQVKQELYYTKTISVKPRLSHTVCALDLMLQHFERVSKSANPISAKCRVEIIKCSSVTTPKGSRRVGAFISDSHLALEPKWPACESPPLRLRVQAHIDSTMR